jgi:hypothetical protein
MNRSTVVQSKTEFQTRFNLEPKIETGALRAKSPDVSQTKTQGFRNDQNSAAHSRLVDGASNSRQNTSVHQHTQEGSGQPGFVKQHRRNVLKATTGQINYQVS